MPPALRVAETSYCSFPCFTLIVKGHPEAGPSHAKNFQFIIFNFQIISQCIDVIMAVFNKRLLKIKKLKHCLEIKN